VLVCTDSAARGIDIPGVTHVVQADFAATAVDFLHRVPTQTLDSIPTPVRHPDPVLDPDPSPDPGLMLSGTSGVTET